MAEKLMLRGCPRCHGTGSVPDLNKLGPELRRRRVKSGISLREVARRTGMSPTHLHDIEHGLRGGPKAQKAFEMFGVSVLSEGGNDG